MNVPTDAKMPIKNGILNEGNIAAIARIDLKKRNSVMKRMRFFSTDLNGRQPTESLANS